ncbi:hypothetical protein [Azospirillum sp. TSA2s]|nr:hypothetical protein [Azospirillum sp. TSA2s]
MSTAFTRTTTRTVTVTRPFELNGMDGVDCAIEIRVLESFV